MRHGRNCPPPVSLRIERSLLTWMLTDNVFKLQNRAFHAQDRAHCECAFEMLQAHLVWNHNRSSICIHFRMLKSRRS
ncbi:hypothetical protein RB3205 [Rhodopirellula baltica SH 1]|uniref:Uncharacterized protein n=1 Tax=Rhodopirellula baltica (strain DSM 10527 / NCIMB 13988 / SH1) TaxID=243090 RepID=Q7UUM3_RHOBA|nr:hypothetical protein RB3205 [Rhodopirellula baltica SH 1]